ncbi:MAG: hypothetical protein ACTHJ9_00815 [Rhodanobacter sp.]
MALEDDGGPVLDVLHKQRIVSFCPVKNGSAVLVEEECDNYFNLLLNKEQFGRLIAELQEMHDKMDSENGA